MRVGLWSVLMSALMPVGGAQAAPDTGARAGAKAPPPVAAMARTVTMPPAYYGVEEAPRGDGLLRAAVLKAHNGERVALGLSRLEWDDGLAADAASYARDIAHSGQFRHSPRGVRAIPSGENLWMGSRGFFAYQAMMDSFIEEKRFTRLDRAMPDVSTTGKWQDVGHYTQMVWGGTKKVGCALSEGPDFDYLVCRYFPAGNVYGQRPLDADDASRRLASGGR